MIDPYFPLFSPFGQVFSHLFPSPRHKVSCLDRNPSSPSIEQAETLNPRWIPERQRRGEQRGPKKTQLAIRNTKGWWTNHLIIYRIIMNYIYINICIFTTGIVWDKLANFPPECRIFPPLKKSLISRCQRVRHALDTYHPSSLSFQPWWRAYPHIDICVVIHVLSHWCIYLDMSLFIRIQTDRQTYVHHNHVSDLVGNPLNTNNIQ
jgi:hypothetical protein